MSARPSLAGRALLAILLLTGFYALALAIVVGLLALVYAQVALLGRISIKLVLICLVAAGTILWSIVPRPDRFEPPGPVLSPKDHPKLFAAIREVAERTGQAMPVEVYLVSDMNAFVAQRGGFMGLFSRRVMGLGLPLMQVLTVSQLKAVLAHEFGHFHGGDTALGPLIYKTRAAIARTVVTLARGGSSVMHKPFEWYGLLFLKITHAISRRQELAADALAARIIGAPHLVAGLKATHSGALAFSSYWRGEYMPAVAAGFRPPLAAGFGSFLGQAKLAEALDKALAAELESDEEDPYDTHPPLPRRIEALQALGNDKSEDDERRAIELLRESDALERSFFGFVVVEDHFAKLVDIEWDEAVARMHVPRWKKQAKALAEHAVGLTIERIPSTPTKLAAFGYRVLGVGSDELDEESAAGFAADRLGVLVAAALVRKGWDVTTGVGEPFVFTKGEHTLQPFNDLHELAAGKLEPEAWLAKLEAAGVARVRIGPKKDG